MKKILSKRIQEMFQLETENLIIRIGIKPEDYRATGNFTFCGKIEIKSKGDEDENSSVIYSLSEQPSFEEVEDKLFNIVEKNFILIPLEE